MGVTVMAAPGRVSPNAGPIAVLAAAALATAAVSLYTLNHLKDAVIGASLSGRPITPSVLLGVLGATDAVLAVLAAAMAAALAWAEWRHRSWSRLLLTASPGEAFACLLIVTAWCGQAYLSPGVLLGGDTGSHIARFLEVSRAFQAGEMPHWTNYQYIGAPLIWFTGPLLYLVGGAVTVLTGDATLAAKILLFTLHVMSGALFFAFLRRLEIRPVPAFVAGCAFACAFAHLHLFLFRGVLPQAFTLVFLVLLFYAADGLMRGPGSRAVNAALFAFATAGLILNHQPHALYAAFYLLVFGAAALWTRAWQVKGLPILVASGVAGVVASAMAVVPTVVESGWVMLEPEGAMFGLRLPTATRLLHLVVWGNTRTSSGIDYWAYLGLAIVLLGVAGIVGAVRGRLPGVGGRFAPGACACLFIGLFLYNPVVRDVQFLLFFGALMAALGLQWLMADGLLPGRRLLLVVAVAVADLLSTSVQPVLRTDKAFIAEAGRYLERTSPGDRVMEVGVEPNGALLADIGPGASPVSYEATVQRVAGNHNMAATPVHNPLEVTVKRAEAELASSGALAPATRTLLALFNVHRIICRTATANGCPARFADAVDDPVLGRIVPIPGATPALFATALAELPEDPGLLKPMFWDNNFDAGFVGRPGAVSASLDRFLAAERPDLATRTAAAIPVDGARDSNADGSPPTRPFAITGYEVGLNTVRLALNAPVAGYVQLAHPWIPSEVVTENGQPARTLRGTLDLLIVPVPAGPVVIVLRDGWTVVRAVSTLVTLVGLLFIPLGAWLLLGRRPQKRPA